MSRYRKPDPAYKSPAQRRIQTIIWIVVVALALMVLYWMWGEVGRT